MKIGMHVPFSIRVLSGYMPRSWIVGSYSYYFMFTFPFSLVAIAASVSSKIVGGISTFSWAFVFVELFNDVHADQCEVLPHNSFDFSSVQSLSHVRLCDPMNRSTPGLPVHHQLPEITQTHVHLVSDAIQPSHPLSSPFPPAPNPSQHQSLSSELTLHMRWP